MVGLLFRRVLSSMPMKPRTNRTTAAQILFCKSGW
jgi:hypothetical protein